PSLSLPRAVSCTRTSRCAALLALRLARRAKPSLSPNYLPLQSGKADKSPAQAGLFLEFLLASEPADRPKSPPRQGTVVQWAIVIANICWLIGTLIDHPAS